jgi:MFS family permease
MAQALVQLNAPHEIRGRVVGLYNMSSLGMRAFSGITVGLIGSWIGIHWSLGLSAAVLLGFLLVLRRRRA